MRDSEWMAIAHNIVNVGANWTGGAVDSGDIKPGLQNREASSPQPATGVQAPGRQRMLSTGETIWDIGGNVWKWTYGDMSGDSNGLFGTIGQDRTAAPYSSVTRGMGWYPSSGTNWSGYAPMRSGYWNRETYAGPFYLDGYLPSYAHYFIGFRCTK